MSQAPARIDWNALSVPEFYVAAVTTGLVRRAIELARDEDLGAGDVSSEAMIPADSTGRAAVVARESGVVAGLACVPLVLDVFGGKCRWKAVGADGAEVAPGESVGEVSGPLRDVLAIERTLLNLVCRLSGIASLTHRYVRETKGTKARVCDTRKTMPGLRMLEKYAVRCGGGCSHRMGLHDAALFKDNHLAADGAAPLGERIANAAKRARELRPVSFVQVEVDSLDQLREALSLPTGTIDMILLDNMNVGTMREAVAMRDKAAPRVLLEASGGVSLETVREIAQAGVDRISVGRLTHSAPALDFGLDLL